MAGRKTVTPQTITGEQGINLIERRCLEMGTCFTRGGSITASTATLISSTRAAGPC